MYLSTCAGSLFALSSARSIDCLFVYYGRLVVTAWTHDFLKYRVFLDCVCRVPLTATCIFASNPNLEPLFCTCRKHCQMTILRSLFIACFVFSCIQQNTTRWALLCFELSATGALLLVHSISAWPQFPCIYSAKMQSRDGLEFLRKDLGCVPYIYVLWTNGVQEMTISQYFWYGTIIIDVLHCSCYFDNAWQACCFLDVRWFLAELGVAYWFICPLTATVNTCVILLIAIF